MHQALYRKWRPQTFDEVCGQEHVTDILRYEIAEGRISHAYLFCGSRGTGKTTCAKILARAVNCEHPEGGNPCGRCDACRAVLDGSATDVLEMDAASNNKVDDIRTILDEVVYTPGMLKYRVYIIDEVHMLTPSAFNALLKTLEEPPGHVIFILATTEMQKLPATIISRCQRFDFRRIATSVLVDRLKFIAGQENIALDPDAALIIARLAQGGMRDAISLFELCSAGGREVTAESVSRTVGFRGRGPMSECVRMIAASDYPGLFDLIASTEASASDIGVFWQELISYYRDMLVFRTAGQTGAVRYLDLTDSEAAALSHDAGLFPAETLVYHAKLLDDAYTSMQRPGVSRRTVAEMTFIRLCSARLSSSPEALLSRIAALEAGTGAGGAAASRAAGPSTAEPAKSPAAADPTETASQPYGRQPETAARPAASPGPVPDRETAPAERSGSPAGAGTATKAPAQAPARAAAAPGASARADADGPKPLRGWAEILEEFGRNNQGAAAMLSTEKAFADASGRIVIRYSKEVTRMLVTRPDTLNALCAAASSVLGRRIAPSELIFEKTDPQPEGRDGADSLGGELGALAGRK